MSSKELRKWYSSPTLPKELLTVKEKLSKRELKYTIGLCGVYIVSKSPPTEGTLELLRSISSGDLFQENDEPLLVDKG